MPVAARLSVLFGCSLLAACSGSGGADSSASAGAGNASTSGNHAGGNASGGSAGSNAGTGGVNPNSSGAAGAPSAGGGAGGSANGGNGGASGASGGVGGNGGTSSGASGNAGTSGSAGSGPAVGTIVPLYTDPSDASWSAIVAAKQAHAAVNVIAIVNPNSGPGASADSGFTKGIDALLAAGIVPIGYVSTSYTARGEPAVKGDIDAWFGFYPKISGIFFDEQSDKTGDDGFYRDVSGYAKGKGATITVGNPGTSVPAAYLSALDIMLVYEDKGLPKLTSFSDAANRGHYGIIPYGAAFDASFVGAVKANVEYVYATSDDLPNPWDSLTPYFDQLLTTLAP
ncbi:MAG TPA: spherulation-specific family 4 protein [Polyangiaceae bacterium]|jgi:hypothetical protein